jgi:thioredoxin 1
MIKNIMKYSFIALLISASMAFSCSNTSVASGTEDTKGIEFKKLTVDQALQLAKEQNKLVFIDAFTTWCGPCKKMARTTFKNEQVGTYFNEHFISIKVDMERGEGSKLEKKYNIRSYPTLLFLETSGKQKKKAIGYHQVGEFMRLAKKVNR